jgi:hypothetical protein
MATIVCPPSGQVTAFTASYSSTRTGSCSAAIRPAL